MAQTKFGGAVIKQLIAGNTAASTVTGTGLDCSALRGIMAVILNSGAASSGDTLDVTIESCATVGGSYTAVNDYAGEAVAFTQVTAAAVSHQIKYIDSAKCLKFVRALGTVATDGGTVAIPFSVSLIGFPQYL